MNLEIIRNLCEKRDGGIKGLAKKIEMSDTNLFRCIRLNKIQAEVLENIALELGVKVGVFFGEVELDEKPAIKNNSMRQRVTNGNASMTIGDTSALMSERVAHLEELLREKERTIRILMGEKNT